MGKTHGLKKLKIPAINAINIEGIKPASIISIPNIPNNTLLKVFNHPFMRLDLGFLINFKGFIHEF